MSETRNSKLFGKITAFMVICCCCLPAQAKYGGGTGELNDPYQIRDANHMQAIGADPCDWGSHFKLMADIDLSSYTGTEFNIIGYYEAYQSPNNIPFTVVFDGNGHTISNFTYDSNDRDCIGLFAYVGTYEEHATIKDLGLIDPNVNAGTADCVGSLVGYMNEGTISGCFVQGGSVSGTGWETGGLVGYNDENAIINCYSTASVSGNHCVGGLVGENDWDEYPRIIYCYSTGSVTGTGLWVGGLVGAGDHLAVHASFWDVNTSGQATSDGGTPKTTAEMKTRSTFTDAWWDFVGETANGIYDIWDICEGTNYPKLSWQIPPLGDFGCPDGVDFFDFSFFAGHWAEENCAASNDCDGRDLDLLGSVDIKDLRIFADNWLEVVKPLLPTSKASNPYPADGAMGVSITADLSWMAGAGATSHDVYFGTSSPPPFITSQSLTTFDPGTLAYLTKHYWRIDEFNTCGTITGTVWSFTTVMSPPPLP